MRLEKIEGAPQARQHTQRKDIDLKEADGLKIVLFPLDDGAVFHGGILDRHHLIEPRTGDDEAPDMLGEMPRRADQLLGKAHRLLEPRIGRIEAGAPGFLLRYAARRPAPERAGEGRDGVRGQPEHFADLADGAAPAIANDGGGQTGSLAAILLVDMLDDLFAPLVLKIHV